MIIFFVYREIPIDENNLAVISFLKPVSLAIPCRTFSFAPLTSGANENAFLCALCVSVVSTLPLHVDHHVNPQKEKQEIGQPCGEQRRQNTGKPQGSGKAQNEHVEKTDRHAYGHG